ncbi:MAG: tyrosine-type recombinase/integrase [Propionivibrio sp.]|uniref:Tyrosine-type recombinase/integrase n=1 Tax=Candidatus Propionivibrio dominans TaxID=2954373 RepID=A0A9D7F9B0_9RHOO|nr:tyrosine-type recombinase/integrase [Candidatus Propionivibrio dominans]
MRSVIEFALETGARQSEITSLVWRDVDTEKRVARIRGIDGRETKKNRYFSRCTLSTKAIAVLNGITRPKTGGLVFRRRRVRSSKRGLRHKKSLKRLRAGRHPKNLSNCRLQRKGKSRPNFGRSCHAAAPNPRIPNHRGKRRCETLNN